MFCFGEHPVLGDAIQHRSSVQGERGTEGCGGSEEASDSQRPLCTLVLQTDPGSQHGNCQCKAPTCGLCGLPLPLDQEDSDTHKTHVSVNVLVIVQMRVCCGRQLVQIAVSALVTAALWAGLLTLLLLWHWDTLRDLKQLEDTAVLNISQVSKDLERHKGDQMAQKSQASQMLQNMKKIQAEQKRMKTQDSELSWNLDGLQEDLSNLKSQGLNERRTALDSLERLQEEVAKLWVELISNGSMCNTCPEKWVNFQRKCYYFGESAKKWIQARYTCSILQGRLVSIHNQEEQDFLAKHINEKGSWIGLLDLNIEGEFVWVDKNPLDYSSWQTGEPNNGDEGEDCVMMLGSGTATAISMAGYVTGWLHADCLRAALAPSHGPRQPPACPPRCTSLCDSPNSNMETAKLRVGS
ncbi:LOW QUALITY PROTEIN: low affinity immunoglobulin epsilon Fc receptor [Rhynchonycteris naso]